MTMDSILLQDLMLTGGMGNAPGDQAYRYTDQQIADMLAGRQMYEPSTKVEGGLPPGTQLQGSQLSYTPETAAQLGISIPTVPGVVVPVAAVAPPKDSGGGGNVGVFDATLNIGGKEVPWSTIIAGLVGTAAGYGLGKLGEGTPQPGDDLSMQTGGVAQGGLKTWTGIGGSQFISFGKGKFACRKADGTIKTWRVPKNIVISGNPRLKDLKQLMRAEKQVSKMLRPYARKLVPKVEYVSAGHAKSMVKV